MKLYSDTLTREDIREAAREAGVWVWELEDIKRARVRAHGWNVFLSGSSSYRSQATGEKAATWDEHGQFMAALYRKDPGLRIAYYRDLAHFLSETSARVYSHWNNAQPASRRLRGPWLDDDALARLAR